MLGDSSTAPGRFRRRSIDKVPAARVAADVARGGLLEHARELVPVRSALLC